MSSEAIVSNASLLLEQSMLPKSFVDFELVYNRHGSAEDARLSCERIAPSSLVFLEGASYESDFEIGQDLHHYVSCLGVLRIDRGVDSEQYVSAKQALLASIRQRKELDGSDEKDPEDDWLFTMYECLIEKDCVIFRADITKSELPEITQTQIDKMMPANGLRGPRIEVDPSKSLGRTIIDAYKNLDNVAKSHHLREIACMAEITDVLVSLFDQYPAEMWQLGRTQSGKIQAYTVWGTAHAYSLTARLEEESFQVSPNIIGDTRYVHFLAPNLELALESTPSVALAELLSLCIFENLDHVNGEYAMVRLLAEIAPAQEGITAKFVRARQLYLETCALNTKWENCRDDDERAVLGPRLSTVTLNLRNILTELGIDPDSYLVNPFTD